MNGPALDVPRSAELLIGLSALEAFGVLILGRLPQAGMERAVGADTMKLPSNIIFAALGWPDIDTMDRGEFLGIVILLVIFLVVLQKLLKN